MNKVVRYGPESKVTVEVVKRVSERIAKGIPIKNALAGEGVTEAAYRRHLQRHRELKDIQETAKLQFLDRTFDLITSRPGPMLRWLLERRHSDIFGGPGGTSDRTSASNLAGAAEPAVGAQGEAESGGHPKAK